MIGPNFVLPNKHKRKPKRKPRLDYPERLATLDTQHEGKENIIIQSNTTKRMSNTDPT
jgi:hypothetical protein